MSLTQTSSLPMELVQKISSKGTLEDLKSLRLVCKAFAALLQRDMMHTLVISISGQDQDPQRGFGILNYLASSEECPAQTAIQELVIEHIYPPRQDSTEVNEQFDARWKASLVPALQSLKHIRKLRLRFQFTESDEMFVAVLGCIRPMMPGLRELEVFGIDSSPHYSMRVGEMLSLLSDSPLHNLTSFGVETAGSQLTDALVTSLTSLAAKVMETSRTNLQRVIFNVPVLDGWSTLSPPATLQEFFGQNTTGPFCALTHLTLNNDFVSDIRSKTTTLPHLCSLTHLRCPLKYRYNSISTGTKAALNQAGKFGFWTVLANTGVRLRSLKDATVSHEMLLYLRSYSGELQELEIACYHTHGEEAVQQEMGADLWNRVIPQHQLTLRSLHISSNCRGWWFFGPQTEDYFQNHSFPQLQQLKVSVERHRSEQGRRSQRDYVNLLLDYVTQSELFPSFTDLLLKFPLHPPPPGSWCGTGRFEAGEMIAEEEKSKILAQKFDTPRASDSEAPQGATALVPQTVARMPNVTILKDFGGRLAFRPGRAVVDGGWCYELAESLDGMGTFFRPTNATYSTRFTPNQSRIDK
ncbi:hypothetical protein FA15DRAFT_669115 [Coprinopsis marcescibilis]|uniref:F-box domain-containing protein n=1 Tax=Coprinopsis marcescibilis TaxID=230819 RepID=A0A5C3KW99_COPMA|nr:hypothetical protein FA15DRAFT_669115 [Coprinopsis marcescibilis]